MIFKTVCKVQELRKVKARRSAGQQARGPVPRVERPYFAIDDVCPHMGASLSGGYVEDGIVTCPWHAWRFRLTDGTWADNPRSRSAATPSASRATTSGPGRRRRTVRDVTTP